MHLEPKGFFLAIETSCDDTSVALLDQGGSVRALLSENQDQAHKVFGGVVPEIAGRNHSKNLLAQIDQILAQSHLTLADVAAIGVTAEPGLLGSLLVGVVTAKALALATGCPLIAVNHLEGHLFAGFLKDATYQPPAHFDFPFLALTVSGGHTSLIEVAGVGDYTIVGETADDAAGEAFDKFAKMVGLGFPGGAKVDQLAKGGRIDAFQFPRGKQKSGDFNFSFSGLKSAAYRLLEKMPTEERDLKLTDLCASYQESIVDALIEKLGDAALELGHKRIVVTGGVSANSRLRMRAQELAQQRGFQLVIPPLKYCTDNAAMIGYVGLKRFQRGERSDQNLAPSPVSRIAFKESTRVPTHTRDLIH